MSERLLRAARVSTRNTQEAELTGRNNGEKYE